MKIIGLAYNVIYHEKDEKMWVELKKSQIFRCIEFNFAVIIKSNNACE